MFNRRPEGRAKQHCIVENGRMQVYHWERSVFRFGPMCEFCNGKRGKRHIKTLFGTRKELKRNKYAFKPSGVGKVKEFTHWGKGPNYVYISNFQITCDFRTSVAIRPAEPWTVAYNENQIDKPVIMLYFLSLI